MKRSSPRGAWTKVTTGILVATPTILLSGNVRAQQAPPAAVEEAETAAPPAGTEAPAADAAAPGAAVPAATSEASPAAEPSTGTGAESAEKDQADAARDAEIAAIREELAALRAQQEETQAATEIAQLQDEADDQDIFSVYGFMDMGIQRSWVDERSLISAEFDTNLTFAVGNIDLYFDFKPHPDWRGLAEIRFTGAPHGRIDNYGGLAGTFQRTDTKQYDPHGAVLNAPMWGGYTVIERAWIEWKRFQQFRVRTGSFFTPFGIWNVDHGSPTLISTALPQFIQQSFFPLRQVGVQALGSFFKDEYEFSYRAWVSNGRQELSNLDFNDDKAFGARLIARRDSGKFGYQLGASYHHGKVADKIIDITAPPPTVTYESYASEAYTENVIGADVSVDLGPTRLRAEYVGQLREWEDGKRYDVGPTASIPGAEYPDSWRHSAYALVAHQLPWFGIEPFIFAELQQQYWDLPDGFLGISPGINIKFNPSAQLKTQVTRAYFFDWKRESAGENLLNTTSAVARIVLAF